MQDFFSPIWILGRSNFTSIAAHRVCASFKKILNHIDSSKVTHVNNDVGLTNVFHDFVNLVVCCKSRFTQVICQSRFCNNFSNLTTLLL